MSYPASLTLASRLRVSIADGDGTFQRAQRTAYGEDRALLEFSRRAVLAALSRFLETHGDRPALVIRVPARISLNPHCEHQGARVPYGLHARELIVVAARGETGRVRITNTDPGYAPIQSLSLPDERTRGRAGWERGWNDYLEAPEVAAVVQERRDPAERTEGKTGSLNYVAAAALRAAHAFPEALRTGLDLTLHGDVPRAGGLSSSSTLVVGTLLAALALIGREVEPRSLAALAGEAEWYVGTRGGAGDHAAMLLARRGGLAHIRFRPPFEVREVIHSAFPDGYELVLANSGIRSEKSAGERLRFNRGIFAYRFAFLALREELGRLGISTDHQSIHCLGDLHSENLPPAHLYDLLRRLPQWISPADLAHRFPETFAAAARGCFGTDDPARLPAEIPLRGAAAYGLARVDRGLVMPALLDVGSTDSMAEFGRLMSVTHDGDRVACEDAPYTENLDRLGDGRIASASGPLREEPGFYGASIPELDEMVDRIRKVEGVLGSGLMGAGGGGYILTLARRGSRDRIREALASYYASRGLTPDVETWRSVAAAGRLA